MNRPASHALAASPGETGPSGSAAPSAEAAHGAFGSQSAPSSLSSPSRRRLFGQLSGTAMALALSATGFGALSLPRSALAAAASANGATIPSNASIVDASGNVWTLVAGHVTKNNVAVATGSTVALTLLLWQGGVIYAKNTAGVWFKNGSPWSNIGATDPRGAAAAAQKLFYGMNGHMAWGDGIYRTMTPAAQLALLKDLGCTVYRCDVVNGPMSQIVANALNGPFKNSGVMIMPVLNPKSGGWVNTMSESAAYTLGYNMGVDCAKPLKGLVTHIECGNELDDTLKISGNGVLPSQWSPQMWPSFRGAIRGMIDGVKAVDSTIKCGVNVGIPMAYGALQMLWNGISPNGTAQGAGGAPLVRWDFTTYHWYHSSGDIECGWNGSCVDVLQVLKDSFGVPIWLTEWGWTGGVDSGAAAATYVTQTLGEYYSLRTKYNLESIQMYCLIDPSYGLIQGDGATKNPAYAAFKSFVAAHPV